MALVTRERDVDRERALRIAAETNARQRAVQRRAAVEQRTREFSEHVPRDWKQLSLFATVVLGLLLATGLGLYMLLLDQVPTTGQLKQGAVDRIWKRSESPERAAERTLPTERVEPHR